MEMRIPRQYVFLNLRCAGLERDTNQVSQLKKLSAGNSWQWPDYLSQVENDLEGMTVWLVAVVTTGGTCV